MGYNGERMLDIRVELLSGDCVTLRVSDSALGSDLQQMLCDQLPSKPGAHISLSYKESTLPLHLPLKEQFIDDDLLTLSCTYLPTDIHAVWCLKAWNGDAKVA